MSYIKTKLKGKPWILITFLAIVIGLSVMALLILSRFFSGQQEELSSKTPADDQWKAVYQELIKTFQADFSTIGQCRFSLHDINQDGLPELFLSVNDKENFVYTFENGVAVKAGVIDNPIYISADYQGVLSYGGYGTGVGGAKQVTLVDHVLAEKEILTYKAMIPNPTEKESMPEFTFEGQIISESEFDKQVARICKRELNWATTEDIFTQIDEWLPNE